MKKYIIKRILISIPLIIGITFIAFCLINLIPSDPAEVALRVNDITPTDADIHRMRELLGLNRPFLLRYFDWLWKSLHFDFGISYVNTNRKVADEIARTLPVTLKLAGISLVMILSISIPIGVLCAVNKNSSFDRITRIIVFFGTAVPDYWLSLILLSIFALKLNIFPISGADALKNSIHSSLNALGMSIVKLVAGTFIIENIFVLPGIGRLCVQAIFGRDYPVIQAYILLMGILFVGCNLLVDIVNCYIDPRLAETEA